MPGPDVQLSFAGVAMEQVYPILPLAPDAPLVVGALSWNGALGLGLATDPTVIDADALALEISRECTEIVHRIEASAHRKGARSK